MIEWLLIGVIALFGALVIVLAMRCVNLYNDKIALRELLERTMEDLRKSERFRKPNS